MAVHKMKEKCTKVVQFNVCLRKILWKCAFLPGKPSAK